MRYSIPTPVNSALGIGPLTIHYYALCIILGVAIAIWLGDKRFRKLCANSESSKGVVADVAIYAVPAGVIGGRIYHVVTSPTQYFGTNGDWLAIFKIYEGGLGIWGAISLGSLAALYAYRRLKQRNELPEFKYFLDALAPGILFAQAIGRFGNWFNGELFGRPTNLPWGLEIPIGKRPSGYLEVNTFHPTFLYEAIWCIAVALLLILTAYRFQGGAIFATYISLYCLGRFLIESIRIDAANQFLGMRINLWTALIVGLAATAMAIRLNRRKLPPIG